MNEAAKQLAAFFVQIQIAFKTDKSFKYTNTIILSTIEFVIMTY